MTVQDLTIAKIRRLPEPLAQQVSDFVDFLLVKQNSERWQLWTRWSETFEMTESDMADYLINLETYEERLAQEEIQW